MAKDLGGASRTDGPVGGPSRETPTSMGAFRALELVAIRGPDVLGVRHLLEGGECWLGSGEDLLARIPMGDYGGQPALFADVREGRCTLHVPARARGRIHGDDKLGRLVTGPDTIEVKEGDRAVVVLGPVSIRARVVSIEASASVPTRPLNVEVRKWLTVMGALYIAALAAAALLAPDCPDKPASRGIRSAIVEMTERLASVGASRLDR